jgi:hypothetical protein
MAANTLVHYYQCSSSENWEIEIKGSTGTHTVTFDRFSHKNRHRVQFDYSCTCKGYKFRGKCRHIEEAKNQHCCWMQSLDGGKLINGKCPKCGAEVKSFRHRI